MAAEKTRSSETTGGKRARARVRRSPATSASKRKRVKRWSAGVHTESTYPEKGLFTKEAATIARSLASKRTSPKGPESGMRMLNFYINRAGHNLSASRQNELEKAKKILSEIIKRKKKSTR